MGFSLVLTLYYIFLRLKILQPEKVFVTMNMAIQYGGLPFILYF